MRTVFSTGSTDTFGLDVDANNDLWVIDQDINAVYKIDGTTGAQTLFSGNGAGSGTAFTSIENGIAIYPSFAPPVTLDFGDAPDSGQSTFIGTYPVAVNEDGALHTVSGPTQCFWNRTA